MMESARMQSQHRQEQQYMHQQQQEEAVREMEQTHHTNATLDRDAQLSSTYRGQTEASNIRIVTPNYKTGEKPGADLKIGSSAAELNAKFAQSNGDYKAERQSEHFRMQIIDPKVVDHAHLPAHAPRDYARKKLIDDFPSLHGRRSMLDLDALEQRRIRTETRPITTSKYLTESVERHRELESSDLSKYLKAQAPAKHDDASLRELDRLRQSIDALQRASREQPKVEPVVIKAEPPPPLPVRQERQQQQQYEIVERRHEVVASRPRVTHTVQKIEETKRTEDVERRIIRRERRHKSHRSRHAFHSGGAHQEYYDSSGGGGWQQGGGGYRSNSSSRFAHSNGNGFGSHLQPIGGYDTGGRDHYGSLSDSLRRGDLKYDANGELREGKNTRRVHKSYSTRDVYGGGGGGGGHYGARHGFEHSPLVEFPPTLPRGGADYGPAPPPHRDGGQLAKSRSYADWDEGHGAFGSSARNYSDDMARLESEFRDARLMRLPDGNMSERDFRHEQIPGGYESYSKESKANAGRRLNREGVPTDFKEASHDYSYQRETQR